MKNVYVSFVSSKLYVDRKAEIIYKRIKKLCIPTFQLSTNVSVHYLIEQPLRLNLIMSLLVFSSKTL